MADEKTINGGDLLIKCLLAEDVRYLFGVPGGKSLQMLTQADRPLIVAGGGVLRAAGWKELQELAEHLQIPVVTSLMGIGSISSQSKCFVGTDWPLVQHRKRTTIGAGYPSLWGVAQDRHRPELDSTEAP